MIRTGQKVQYIGEVSPENIVKKTGKGKIGTVISNPYYLENAGDTNFVDVEWNGDKIDKHEFIHQKGRQRGHVVNVENLKVIKMAKYIYSDFIPDEVGFFTSGKRYEVISELNDYKQGTQYQVFVIGDDGKEHGPINVGWPCAYLDDHLWSVEEKEIQG
jgi:hypothetical protein